MINFIICEDDKNMVAKVIDIINTYMSEKEYSFSIGFVNDSAKGVMDYVKQNRDKKNVYILDIDLQDTQNGMQLAKEIRKYDYNGEIIFLTSHVTMVMYVFKLRLKALDFIDKQEDIKQRLIGNFEVIINNFLNSREQSCIIVKCGTRVYTLKLDEIINIQTTSINGKLRASTIDGQIEFYGHLKDIENELDERFYRSHRGCIINKEYIKMINKEKYNLYILMTNGEKSLLSKNYLKGLVSKND